MEKKDEKPLFEISPEFERDILEAFPITGTDDKQNNTTKRNAYVNGNVYGTCKHGVNALLTQSKHDVITLLKKCTYRTPPLEVATLLEILFDDPGTNEGHWLHMAQDYPPRAICRTITQMIKQHRRGEISILNPAAYFTKIIKYRAKRKERR
jgi:hypothetical protein